MAKPIERNRAARLAAAQWAQQGGHRTSGPEVLISSPGIPMERAIRELQSRRDNRPLLIVE